MKRRPALFNGWLVENGVRRRATRAELQEATRLWLRHFDIREGRGTPAPKDTDEKASASGRRRRERRPSFTRSWLPELVEALEQLIEERVKCAMAQVMEAAELAVDDPPGDRDLHADQRAPGAEARQPWASDTELCDASPGLQPGRRRRIHESDDGGGRSADHATPSPQPKPKTSQPGGVDECAETTHKEDTMQGKRTRALDSRGRPVPGLYVRDGIFIAGFKLDGRWIMRNLSAATLTEAKRTRACSRDSVRGGSQPRRRSPSRRSSPSTRTRGRSPSEPVLTSGTCSTDIWPSSRPGASRTSARARSRKSCVNSRARIRRGRASPCMRSSGARSRSPCGGGS